MRWDPSTNQVITEEEIKTDDCFLEASDSKYDFMDMDLDMTAVTGDLTRPSRHLEADVDMTGYALPS
jgi:hypothetical protein